MIGARYFKNNSPVPGAEYINPKTTPIISN
jgi:hypothetical protein